MVGSISWNIPTMVAEEKKRRRPLQTSFRAFTLLPSWTKTRARSHAKWPIASAEIPRPFSSPSKVHNNTSKIDANLTKSGLFLSTLFSTLDVPSSPGMVRLSAIKSRSLEISWSRPHDGNSPILNYIIEYSNLPGSTHSRSQFATQLRKQRTTT